MRLAELVVVLERAVSRLKNAKEKCIVIAQIQTKDGLNQSGGQGNEKEVIDAINLMKVKFI